MHIPVLIVSDHAPLEVADELVVLGLYDCLRWEEIGPWTRKSSWAAELGRYVQPAVERQKRPVQRNSRMCESTEQQAPCLSQVDILALLGSTFNDIWACGTLYRRQDWCVAHQRIEVDPHFERDVLAAVKCLHERRTRNQQALRIWVFDAHV